MAGRTFTHNGAVYEVQPDGSARKVGGGMPGPNPIKVREAQIGIAKGGAEAERTSQAIGIDANKDRREEIALLADLAKHGLHVVNGQVVPIPDWRPPAGEQAARAAALRDRVTALTNLEGSLQDVQGQYDRNFRGQPISRLGGLSEYMPGMFNAKNEEFNTSSKRLGPFIQSILGLTGKEADAAAEYERKVMPFIPKATEQDPTTESKLRQMWGFLNTQRAATHRELGLPPPPRVAPRGRPARSTVIQYDEHGNRVR